RRSAWLPRYRPFGAARSTLILPPRVRISGEGPADHPSPRRGTGASAPIVLSSRLHPAVDKSKSRAQHGERSSPTGFRPAEWADVQIPRYLDLVFWGAAMPRTAAATPDQQRGLDLSGFLPESLTKLDDPQKDIPRIAKDPALTAAIERALPQIPTVHHLYRQD